MQTRHFQIIAWVLLGLCIAATVVPIGLRPHASLPANADRALAFAALGFAFGLAYPRRWLMVCLFLLLAAFSIESLQFLAPSRHPGLPDAMIKATGAIVGVAAAQALVFVLGRRSGRLS
ncbi:MAG: VanZ family protein [Rhizobium sp.]|nr:VanZ family protein [Rhizobium sp.]